MYTCDVYETHDFGNGPVELRCTVAGRHTIHICRVNLFNGEKKASEASHEEGSTRRNVFDQSSQ